MHHRANRLALQHQVKRPVDLLQPHGVGNKGLQFDLALHGIFHHARQLAAALHATKSGTLPGPPGDQLERTGGNFLPGTGHADDHRLTPATESTLQRCPHHLDVADAFKGVIHSPASHLDDHFLDRLIVIFGVDAVDRKSTRLNSSHVAISYAVFCLKKKSREIYSYCINRYYKDVLEL